LDVKTCTQSGLNEDWQKIEDKDTRIDYGGNNPSRSAPYWDLHTESGGYVLSADTAHACRTDINLGCVAKMNITTTAFSTIQVGFTEGPNRTSADVFIDNVKIGEINSNNTTSIIDFHNYHPWTSPNFECGKHEIKIVPNGRTGINAKSFDMDYLQIKPCIPNSNETHLACDPTTKTCKKINSGGNNQNGCTKENDDCEISTSPKSTTHLICQNNACVSSDTATSTDPACAGEGKEVGSQCGVRPEDLKCQGNVNAPAKCFDCVNDISTKSTVSEINTLDFSCFAKLYGKNVGKD
jgi:hypothetical protein